MNNGGKQKTSTEEAEAIGRFTSEQLMALRDIVSCGSFVRSGKPWSRNALLMPYTGLSQTRRPVRLR